MKKSVEESVYMIKTGKHDDKFMIDDRDNKNLSDALTDYHKDCPDLTKDIANKEYALSNPENLKNIIVE